MAVKTYSKTGSKATTPAKLSKEVFGLDKINSNLLKQAYVAYLANGRINLAKSKTRGQVRGGGIKPWKQKGTGRARVGSRRTPLWRGGGIIFGPTGNESYSQSLNLKTKRLALRQALTAANQENRLRVLEELKLPDVKTASAIKLFNKLDISGYTLVIDENPDANVLRATANLNNIKLINARYINVARIMDSDTIIITKPALKVIETLLTKEGK